MLHIQFKPSFLHFDDTSEDGGWYQLKTLLQLDLQKQGLDLVPFLTNNPITLDLPIQLTASLNYALNACNYVQSWDYTE